MHPFVSIIDVRRESLSLSFTIIDDRNEKWNDYFDLSSFDSVVVRATFSVFWAVMCTPVSSHSATRAMVHVNKYIVYTFLWLTISRVLLSPGLYGHTHAVGRHAAVLEFDVTDLTQFTHSLWHLCDIRARGWRIKSSWKYVYIPPEFMAILWLFSVVGSAQPL